MKKLSQNGGKAVLALCEIIVGILLFADPTGLTSTIIKVIGAVITLSGVVSVIHYFLDDPVSAHLEQGLVKGLCSLAVGLFCIFSTSWFIKTFEIAAVIYGIAILFTGIVRVQWTVDMLRMKTGRWYLAGIGAVISLVFGFLIVSNPFKSTDFLWKFAAVALIVDAVLDIVAMLFGRASKGKDEEE